jgi:hypothetical protein
MPTKPPPKPVTCTYLIFPTCPGSQTSPLVCGKPAETAGWSPRCHRHTPGYLKSLRDSKRKSYREGKTRLTPPSYHHPLPPPDVDVVATNLI